MKKLMLALLVFVSFSSHAQLTQLDNYCGDTTFDFTPIDDQFGLTLDSVTITYHLNESDAVANVNAIVETTNYQSLANPQIIYARVQNLTLGSIFYYPFDLIVNNTLNVGISATLNDPTSNFMAWGEWRTSTLTLTNGVIMVLNSRVKPIAISMSSICHQEHFQ